MSGTCSVRVSKSGCVGRRFLPVQRSAQLTLHAHSCVQNAHRRAGSLVPKRQSALSASSHQLRKCHGSATAPQASKQLVTHLPPCAARQCRALSAPWCDAPRLAQRCRLRASQDPGVRASRREWQSRMRGDGGTHRLRMVTRDTLGRCALRSCVAQQRRALGRRLRSLVRWRRRALEKVQQGALAHRGRTRCGARGKKGTTYLTIASAKKWRETLRQRFWCVC